MLEFGSELPSQPKHATKPFEVQDICQRGIAKSIVDPSPSCHFSTSQPLPSVILANGVSSPATALTAPATDRGASS